MKILVLEEFADVYQRLSGADWIFSTGVTSAPPDCDVVLGQPDMVSAYLGLGNSPVWVQSTWAGVTNLVDQAKNNDVIVTGVKGLFGPMIAEYVFAHLLADTQKLDAHQTSQNERRWQPIAPLQLRHLTMTLVGTGSIGAHVATLARAFNMRVLGVSRHGDTVQPFDRCVTVAKMRPVLAESDVVVLTLPDTEQTRGLFDQQTLEMIKPGGVLINVGRGTVVDHEALVSSLDDGHLRRAVLDVFPQEPLPEDSPLWHHPCITITPHVAAPSHPADILSLFRTNLERFERHEPLLYTVNLEQGY